MTNKEGPFNYDDGAFTVWLSRFGMWKSYDREGNGLCSSLSKDDVVFWSREHLNGYANSHAITTRVSFENGYKL